MGKDELQIVVDYVTDDSGVFDTQKFQRMWPSDPNDQSVVMGLLAAKSYRENKKQNKTNTLQWGFIILSLVLSTVGFVHVFGADQLVAAFAGVAVGAMAQGLKLLFGNS